MRRLATLLAVMVGFVVGALLLSLEDDIPLAALLDTYAGPTSQFAKIDGVSVHYRDEGAGPALFLIHGSNASLHTWDGWAARLKDKYRVVRLDLSGHGLTGPDPKSRYAVSDYVRLVEGLRAHLSIENASLAGNSLGGWIAWTYALRHPKRVEKLILIDAAGYPLDLDQLPLVMQYAGSPIFGPILARMASRAALGSNIRQLYGDPSRVSEGLVSRYMDMLLRAGNRQATYERFSQHLSFAGAERISSISVPTLIMWGAHDTLIPPKDGKRFHREIKNSVLRMYPDFGHMPMEEAPEITVRDARAFLESGI
jgi:pimeloyl-ACP methyl ester carboxylesterase